jgi:hypothetical protein
MVGEGLVWTCFVFENVEYPPIFIDSNTLAVLPRVVGLNRWMILKKGVF